MNKISVIVPVYNVEKYLKRCLDSIINQTFKDIEIICINDGSTDNSGEILNSYAQKDKRIKIIEQTNSGLSAVRNKGIDIASGEYISFIDSDDWIDKNFYENLYNAACKNDADIAACGIIRLSEYRKKYLLQFEKEITLENPDKKFEICDIPDINYVWNKIYKLDKIRKYNLKFLEGYVYEDVLFTPQTVFYLKKLVTVPDTYYYYWRTPNSIVAKKSNKKDLEHTRTLALEFIKKHKISIEKHITKVKRYKIFGISFLKIRTKGSKKQYLLFNIIKFGKIKKRG